MEYVSPYLTNENVRAVWNALPSVSRTFVGEQLVIAMYGALANIHPDLKYVGMKVHTSWMDKFLKSSEEQDIVAPGDGDLSFDLAGVELILCHEQDLHVLSESQERSRELIELLAPHSGFDFDVYRRS